MNAASSTENFQRYNLSDDIGENVNVAAAERDRVKDMTMQYKELVAAGRSTPGPK